MLRAWLSAFCVVVPCAVAAQIPSQHGAFSANLQAASVGDPHAQFMLGEAYRLGQGVGQDMNIAEDWYRRAARQGDRGAARELGLKLGDDQLWREAILWLTFANVGGDPKTTALLAARAGTGSTAHDRDLALSLMRDARLERKGARAAPTETKRQAAIAPHPIVVPGVAAREKPPQHAETVKPAEPKSPPSAASGQRIILLQLGAYGSAAKAERAWVSATEKLPSLRNERHVISPAGAAFRLTIEMQSMAAARTLSDQLTRVAWPNIIRSN